MINDPWTHYIISLLSAHPYPECCEFSNLYSKRFIMPTEEKEGRENRNLITLLGGADLMLAGLFYH